MIVLSGLLLLIPALHGGNAELEQLIAELRTRDENWRSISMKYERTSDPTESFVEQYSLDRNRPRDQVRAQFTFKTQGAFLVERGGRFHFEETSTREGRDQDQKVCITYNSKEQTTINSVNSEGEWIASQVLVDNYEPRMVQPYLAPAPFLMLSLFGSHSPLLETIEHGSTSLIGIERIGDTTDCYVLQTALDRDGVATRLTIWLDKAQGLCVRRVKTETLGDGRWSTRSVATVESVDSTANPTGSAFPKSWYPSNIRIITYNSQQIHSFSDHIKLTELRLNIPHESSQFTPVIEDGSSVIDRRNGKTWVQGNGPSPRLKKIIDKQVEAARSLAREAATREPPRVLHTESTLWSTVSWVACIVGGIGSVTGIILLCVRRYRL